MGRKSGKIVIIVIFMLLLVIALGIGGYLFLKINKPKYIFDNTLDNLLASNEVVEYESIKADAELQLNLEKNDMIDDKIVDLINELKLNYSVEAKKDQIPERIALKLSDGKDELLDCDAKIDVDGEKAYINLGELFSKTIQIDMKDIEDTAGINKSIENEMKIENLQKCQEIVVSEMKKEITEEYFSSEKVSVNDENLLKSTLNLTEKDIMKITKNILTHLSSNDEFLSCFKDSDKVKEDINDLLDEIDDYKEDQDSLIQVSIYTKGLKKEIRKFEAIAVVDDKETKIEVSKLTDDECEYNIFYDKESIADGKFKAQGNSNIEFSCNFNIEGIKAGIDMKINAEYNADFSKFDKKDTVKIDELPTDEIFENFQNSKLMKKIEDVFGDILGNALGQSMLDDSYSSLDIQSEGKNVLETSNGKKLGFDLPEKYNKGYSLSDDFDYTFNKYDDDYNSSTVSVAIKEMTQQDYLNKLQEKVNGYTENEDYKDINIEKQDKFEINGREFLRVVVSYKDYYFNNDGLLTREAFITSPIDDENLYILETEDAYDLISDEDIEGFLKLEQVEE